MEHLSVRSLLLSSILFSVPAISSVMAQSGPTEGYRDHAAVVEQLEAWTKEHSDKAKLVEIGTSAGGRKIHALEIAASGTIAPDQRQGIFVGANMAGPHNTGTEAALHFIEYALTSDEAKDLREQRVIYVVPLLNPDAHEGFFANPRMVLRGNGSPLDRDRDGFQQEDGPTDFNGDGVITKLRVEDPTGTMIIDPENPYLMRKADPEKGEVGKYRVMNEGWDADNDGKYTEDGPGGMEPDRNFAHAFPHELAHAGLWAGYTPEAKSIMDYLFARSNIALAVVFGPANNFLAAPRSLGGAVDTGNLKLELPREVAEFLGFDPDKKYSIDEVWAVAKDLPVVKQNNLTKEDVAQFLGVGPATKPTDDDLKLINFFAEKYKKNLEEAGLDTKRQGKQYRSGGFTPWLYYQYGALAVELDVWGVPKPEQKKEENTGDELTLEKLGKMSSEDFLALGEEKIAAFLKENKVPAQYSASVVMNMVKGGQLNPERMVEILKQMGAGGAGGSSKKGKGNDLLTFVEAHAPTAKVPWTDVKLPNGKTGQVGGIDPYIAYNPPHAMLEKPLSVHAQFIKTMSEHLAEVKIVKTEVEKLGGSVFRVKVSVANHGTMPTHTGLAVKAKTHLPVRLGLEHGDDVTVIRGKKWETAPSLAGKVGTMTGQWILKAKSGTKISARVLTDHAGSDSVELTLEEGGGQ